MQQTQPHQYARKEAHQLACPTQHPKPERSYHQNLRQCGCHRGKIQLIESSKNTLAKSNQSMHPTTHPKLEESDHQSLQQYGYHRGRMRLTGPIESALVEVC